MSRLLIGFIALILLAACNKDRKPADIVSQKEMVSLLSDFHLAEGYIYSLPQDSSRLLANKYYQAVFDKYGVDSASFHKSLIYYSQDPQTLNGIYAQVEQHLQQMQTTEQGIRDAKTREIYIADSIKNAAVQDSVLRIKADSLDWQLTKNLLFWKNKDSIALQPKPWSREAYQAFVGRMFLVKGSNEKLAGLLGQDTVSQTTSLDSLKNK
ncbi:DUF4296 domain-containing protein [Olivibacter sp. SDN3]|uniref:DUF4296 domain-containing protein n=1 Tax=Olivibacter sp. SDN3 TaxID=2764720 RepID=UPI001651A5F4|nr:DUF4296 domain-containing protein [Olivibacter sp. SDN3]QNL49887.1 DUF4296 domain-containing protein [Olivibacter sp. SDN3]